MEKIFDLALLFMAVTLLVKHRLFHYLRFLQQEDYAIDRFREWNKKNRAFDKKGTSLFLSSIPFAFLLNPTLVLLALLGGVHWITKQEKDPRSHGKLRLQMTARAKRIYRTAFALYLGVALFLMGVISLYDFYVLNALSAILLIQLTPLWLVGAVFFLRRGEERLQEQYVREAKNVFNKISPFTIGITGSYGKTSTKQALGDILNLTLAPTFWPKKGINTPMGITREIRTRLQKGYRYAVIEMGAYGPGSIAHLCSLTPPQAAIITSIGTAHLERFGSREIILKAKAELAAAVPVDGILVCNGDDPGARQIATIHRKKTTLLYGTEQREEPLDCQLLNWEMKGKGTAFTLRWKEKKYEGWSPTYGKLPLLNLMAAFTMACALGADPTLVLAAIRSQEPVENRLQPKKEGNSIYLHDAYNSNPRGFFDALDVMKQLPGKRRILMTPGMIELGTIQDEENKKVAAYAATVCDYVLVVGKTNRHSLVRGLTSEGMAENQFFVHDTRSSAFEQLATLREEGDIILIENDLPDLYEAAVKF